MAFVKRMIQLGSKSGICTTNSSRWLSSNSSGYKAVDAHILPDAKHTPTTSLSIPSKAIPSVMSEISNGSFNYNLRRQEANVLEFNSDFKKLQDDHCWMAQNHTQMLNTIKELRQLMNETSKEMAKIIAGQGSGLDPSEKKVRIDDPAPSENKDCCRHCDDAKMLIARRASGLDKAGSADIMLFGFMNLLLALMSGLAITVTLSLAAEILMHTAV